MNIQQVIDYFTNIPKTETGLLHDEKDRKKAAKLIKNGEIVGIFNRGVCALWFDGNCENAIKKLWKIKGEGRVGKPFALTIPMDEFIKLIDENYLHSSIKHLLTSELKNKIGSLCFIRAPLKKHSEDLIPRYAKSFNSNGICIIQNWDSFGHPPTESLIEEVRVLGVIHPGVTSMNKSGEKEIVSQREGEKFCAEHNIPLFLKDANSNPFHVGSYTIFSFSKEGIRLERDGNIPGHLFKNIFQLPIIEKDAKGANHPQLIFPKKVLEKLSPAQVRAAIIQFIEGKKRIAVT